ncbi:MAG: hypothetical protein AAGA08_05925 [Pseudomonadota bacterium]
MAQSEPPEIDLDAPLPPDITRDFAATYGFPVVENRILMIDDSFEAVKRVGQPITPFGIPLTYRLFDLRKPWNSYLALRSYTAGEKTPDSSMAVLEPIIDAQGRSFILSQIGMAPLIGLNTHESFIDHVFRKGDEFDVEAFRRFVQNLYGSAPPMSGMIQVMNLKTIEFGGYDFDQQALPVLGISDLATSFGEYEVEVIFPDQALRSEVAIAEAGAQAKVRPLPRQGSYLDGRNPRNSFGRDGPFITRSGTMAVAGRLVIPADVSQPMRYYLDQVALYTNSTMSTPVPDIGVNEVFLDVGTPRRAEAETARLEALRAEAKRQAREAAAMIERAERYARSIAHALAALAADTAAAEAAYAAERARIAAELDGLTLDLLGVSLGMSERQALAGLRALRGSYKISYANRSGRAEITGSCRGGIYSGQIGLATAFERTTGNVIAAENGRAVAHAAANHLEDNPNCRADLQAYGPSIVADVQLGFIGQDRIEVIFAPSGPMADRVVAIRRQIQWDLAKVPALEALRAKHGETRLTTQNGAEIWLKDADRFLQASTKGEIALRCFDLPFRSSGRARSVTDDCGVFLAAQESGNNAQILLIDSTHIVERRTARDVMTLNRAKMTAEAVEF